MHESEVRRRSQQLLRRLGPVPVQELAARLADEAGDEAAIDAGALHELLLEEADDEFAAFPLVDGRLCDLEHLLEGLTVTHELDPDERADGVAVIDPDLSVLHVLSPDGRTFPLADGTEGTYADDAAELLAGPPGWLPDAPVLVARITNGAIVLEGADELPGPHPVTVQRLRETYDAVRDLVPFLLDVPMLLIEARARAPRLLERPEAPIADLLAAAGIPVDGERLDVDDPREEVEALVDHLREDHGFDADEARAVLELAEDVEQLSLEFTRMLSEHAPPSPPEQLVAEIIGAEAAGRHLTAVLQDSELALAVAHDVLGSDPLAAVSLLGLIRGAQPRPREKGAKANLHWLTGTALELAADDHRDAEREFRRAHEADDRHAEAIVDLARYLSDRGKAGAALGMLRLVEGGDLEPWKALLERYAAPGPMSAGRNEPCPCGSGRKHKVCCHATGGWPLVERIDWIWDKLVRFSVTPAAADLIAPVVAAASDQPGPAALQDLAVANLVLFEGGLIEELCELRGDLLPPDELALLRDWAQVEATAYEVVEVDSTAPAITLLDLTTGERETLADHSLSRSVSPDDAVLAWLVPTPEGPVGSGGVLRIPDQHRRHLLKLLDEGADAVDLGRWYASLGAPPRLATTEGDPLTFITRTYRVADPAAARAALATRLDDDGEQLLSLSDGEDGHRWVRGSVTVESDRLVVETSSASRAAWFADLLEELVPEAQLVDEERRPLDELRGDRDDEDDEDDGGGSLDLDALSPDERADIEAHLDELMTRHEDAWIDTELPALDGATPRQAADDPTRRPALVRLLDEFDEHARSWDSPGRPMDAERLRRLLGL